MTNLKELESVCRALGAMSDFSQHPGVGRIDPDPQLGGRILVHLEQLFGVDSRPGQIDPHHVLETDKDAPEEGLDQGILRFVNIGAGKIHLGVAHTSGRRIKLS